MVLIELAMLACIGLAAILLPNETPLRSFLAVSSEFLIVGNYFLARAIEKRRGDKAKTVTFSWSRILLVFAILDASLGVVPVPLIGELGRGNKKQIGSEFMQTNSKRAVVLLSGGLDSATVLAIAKAEGTSSTRSRFPTGSATRGSLKRPSASPRPSESRSTASRTLICAPSVDRHLPPISMFPRAATPEEMSHGIPVTYVPARNTIFLAFALAWAEVLGASDIFLGVNALDYSGYPDCRPEFIDAFEKMANLATKAGVEGRQHLKIHTPLIALTKAQIIATGCELGRRLLADQQLLRSLNRRAMRPVRLCLLRQKGFRENGIEDPLLKVAVRLLALAASFSVRR